jgi:hypothetical protein
MAKKYDILDITSLKERYLLHYKAKNIDIYDHKSNFECWCLNENKNIPKQSLKNNNDDYFNNQEIEYNNDPVSSEQIKDIIEKGPLFKNT